jgi:hypothetical protein
MKSNAMIYVGVKADRGREVFRSETTPTRSSHGEKYVMVIGPCETMQGAQFMKRFGEGNPHVRYTGDAERLARRIRRSCTRKGEMHQ